MKTVPKPYPLGRHIPIHLIYRSTMICAWIQGVTPCRTKTARNHLLVVFTRSLVDKKATLEKGNFESLCRSLKPQVKVNWPAYADVRLARSQIRIRTFKYMRLLWMFWPVLRSPTRKCRSVTFCISVNRYLKMPPLSHALIRILLWGY